MNNLPSPPLPTFTPAELDAIFRPMFEAREELIDMVEVNGPLSAIWIKPRKYFAPEPGTDLPFPNQHLIYLLEPVTRSLVDAGADANEHPLVGEILLYWQFFELVRREIIPERFSS